MGECVVLLYYYVDTCPIILLSFCCILNLVQADWTRDADTVCVYPWRKESATVR